jgi:hypothetical protein
MALAHMWRQDSATYNRSDLFDKRRRLMQACAEFLSKAPPGWGTFLALRRDDIAQSTRIGSAARQGRLCTGFPRSLLAPAPGGGVRCFPFPFPSYRSVRFPNTGQPN